MSKNDEMGDRMKGLEALEASRKFMPGVPLVARLDGRCFSKWTKNLGRPYDERLSGIMVDTAIYLVGETRASVGYTQSDEITLVYNGDAADFFDRKVHKMVSVLSSMATAKFNSLVPEAIPENKDRMACFDCRVWMVPSEMEAVNSVLWREFDATKNSISMSARGYFSHKKLQGLNGKEMQELLWQEHNVNWNDYPSFFKRGSYIRRVRKMKELTAEELERIPEEHRPEGPVERMAVERIDLPPLSKVVNRVDVLLYGADPLKAEDME